MAAAAGDRSLEPKALRVSVPLGSHGVWGGCGRGVLRVSTLRGRIESHRLLEAKGWGSLHEYRMNNNRPRLVRSRSLQAIMPRRVEEDADKDELRTV